MTLPPLILASISPRRAELLRQLPWNFSVIPSDALEIHHDHLTATEIAQVNAYRKARAVAKKFPDALVMGADTLVYLGTQLFGKPADLAEARRILTQLQGRTHQVITGVCLIHLRGHRQKAFAESTDVTFRPLSSEQIGDYLSRISPLDKAGAYAIQEHGDLIVEKISGSFSNVVGLPVERVREQLLMWEGALGASGRRS
jgi:septum formation protein